MAGGSASQVRRVMLAVDDEEDIVTTLAGYVEGTMPWIEVRTAASGAEGLEQVRRGDVDLVMSDFRMPGMDGVEFLGHVARESPRTRRVLMTAYPDVSLALRAANELHVDRFLVKPVEPSAVKAILMEILPQ